MRGRQAVDLLGRVETGGRWPCGRSALPSVSAGRARSADPRGSRGAGGMVTLGARAGLGCY